MRTPLSLLIFSLSRSLIASAGRTISVKNSCGTTVYPAYAGQGGQVTLSGGEAAQPAWELAAGGTTDLVVPDNWVNARIWLRSGGCNGNVDSCQIGKCNGGGNNCDGQAFGSVGATVAEFGMGGGYGDFYDVSMVEGFTVSMAITPSDSSCTVASCGAETDILAQCDPRLVWPKGSDTIYGCAAACTAGIMFMGQGADTFNWQACPSCCNGQWLRNCPSTNAPFYDVYKPMCKNGYIFAKDDVVPDQTAVFNCASGSSYVVELCAGGITTGISDPPSAADAVVQDPGGQLNVPEPAGGGGGGGDPSSQGGGQVTSTTDTISHGGTGHTSAEPPPVGTSVVVPGPSTTEVRNPEPTSHTVAVPPSVIPSGNGGVWPSGNGESWPTGDHGWGHHTHGGHWGGGQFIGGTVVEPSQSDKVCKPKSKRGIAKQRLDQ